MTAKNGRLPDPLLMAFSRWREAHFVDILVLDAARFPLFVAVVKVPKYCQCLPKAVCESSHGLDN